MSSSLSENPGLAVTVPSPPAEPIFELASECDNLFPEAVDGSVGNFKNLLQEYQRRFDAWTAYLGVFSFQSASLDHRLRNHPDLEDAILGTLDILLMNLLQVLPHNLEESDHSHDIAKIALDGVRDAIVELNKLGMTIRRSSRSSLETRVKSFAARKLQDEIRKFSPLALGVVETLYPNAATSFHHQLSKYIVDRYAKLFYWESHNKKLGEDRRGAGKSNDPISGVGMTEILGSQEQQGDTDLRTTAPPFIPGITGGKHAGGNQEGGKGVHLHFDGSETEHSTMMGPVLGKRRSSHSEFQTDASSVLLSGVDYPPPPKVSKDAGEVFCDICGKMIDSRQCENDSRWRKHVDSDLDPYICISERCVDNPTFSSVKSWQSHMRKEHGNEWSRYVHESPTWHCNLEHDKTFSFSSLLQFEDHCRVKHKLGKSSPEDFKAFANQSISWESRQLDVCPLCCRKVVVADARGTGAANDGDRDTSSELIQPTMNDDIKLVDRTRYPEKHSTAKQRKVTFDGHAKMVSDDENGNSHLPDIAPSLGDQDLPLVPAMSRHIAEHLLFVTLLTLRLMPHRLHTDGKDDLDGKTDDLESGQADPEINSTGENTDQELVRTDQNVLEDNLSISDEPNHESSATFLGDPIDWEQYNLPNAHQADHDNEVLDTINEAGDTDAQEWEIIWPALQLSSRPHELVRIDMELFRVDQELVTLLSEMDSEELCGFAAMESEGAASDTQVELHLYACLVAFTATGAMKYLEKAARQAEEWVGITPVDHPDQARRLRILAMISARMLQLQVSLTDLVAKIVEEYQRTGDMNPLEEAIRVKEQELNIAQATLSDICSIVTTLASLLILRHELGGSLDSLSQAIAVIDLVISSTPHGHPDLARRLTALGHLFEVRFSYTKSSDDIDRAIKIIEKAIKIAPTDDPTRSRSFYILGSLFGDRFELCKNMDDLNRAIEAMEMAIDIAHGDDSAPSETFYALGMLFNCRFELCKTGVDLDLAIQAMERAIVIAPIDDTVRADFLLRLGVFLESRFHWTRDENDFERSASCFTKGWGYQDAPPFIRVRLAQKAAALLSAKFNWNESSMLLQNAVKLLPFTSPRLWQHVNKQHMLADLTAQASEAAATALSAGKEASHALALLELGRAVAAGFCFNVDTDISDLKRQRPELAKAFVSVRDEIDSPTGTTSFTYLGYSALSRKLRAGKLRELETITQEIRATPGFQNFLFPPSEGELKMAARLGPIVVVNLSLHRCDAFLIEEHGIRVLRLPKLSLKEVEQKADSLSGLSLTPTLAWLWNVVAQPCLDALGRVEPHFRGDWPRVWWIPTGALSCFPLHAAGLHSDGFGATVLDRVMSSYSFSLKAMLYGRRVPHGQRSSLERAVLISMQNTPQQSSLPFAKDEIARVAELCASLQLEPIRPTPFRKDVLSRLGSCEIFHFAGHGILDLSEPSRSCLLLQDWAYNPLTLADLGDIGTSPFFTYLSTNRDAKDGLDKRTGEAVHFAGACHIIGFRHVLGPLWAVQDKLCMEVATIFYKNMEGQDLTDIGICQAFHRTMMELRYRSSVSRLHSEMSIKDPPHWAAFVYFGI